MEDAPPAPFGGALCAAILFLIAALFFWPLLAGGRALFFGDVGLYFVPMLAVQRAEMVDHGRIALWNPHLFCGTPFIGNPQAWSLYPSSLLLYALSAGRAVGIMGALAVLWASLGAFAFLRSQGRSEAAALFAAIVWAYGGAMIAKLQFPNMVQAAAQLPWLLLAVEGIVRRPSAFRAALLGVVVGLALLAAHPQIFLMEMVLALVWAIGRGASGDRWRILACFLGGLALGAGLAAGQLLPTLELLRHTARQPLSLDQASRFVLPFYACLTNFLSPNYFGNPALHGEPYIGRGNFWESCCYIGLLPFLLAVMGGKFREGRFWVVVAVLCIWLALGKVGGLYAAAFYILPGLSRFHDAARFLIPGTFALACLASIGFEALVAVCKPRWRVAAMLLIFLLTLADLLPFDRGLNPTVSVQAYAGKSGVAGRVYNADESRIWGAFIDYRSYDAVATEERAEEFLASGAPNLSEFAGEDDACGYDPVVVDGASADCARLKDALVHKRVAEADRLMDAMGVQTLIGWDRYRKAREIVERGNPARAHLDTLPLVVQDITPQVVRISLPSGHPEGVLHLADTAYPGWRVRIDGRLADWTPDGRRFRDVPIEARDRVVTFSYEPDSWCVGMFFSLISVGILASLLASTAVRVVRH